jgi:hypothetical protein
LKQLNSNQENIEENKTLHDFMLRFLDEYNKLSSYVHGGPFSEKETYDDSRDLMLENQKTKDWAASALNTIEQHIFLFLGNEKKEYLWMLKPILENQ